MKKAMIYRAVAMIALMLAFSICAQAQYGGPSAEAKAADPMANDNNIPRGFTKTNAQIRAAYEKLDPNVFIYQPYYKYLDLRNHVRNGQSKLRAYVVDLDQDITEYSAVAYMRKISQLFDRNRSLTDKRITGEFTFYYKMTDPKGNTGYIPAIDALSNSLAVLVLADPNSDYAIELAINSILLDRTGQRFEGKLVMEDPSTGTIDSKKKMYLLKNTGQYERSQQVISVFKGNSKRQARVLEYAKAKRADVQREMESGYYSDAALSMRKLIETIESLLENKKEKEKLWAFINNTQETVWQHASMVVSPAKAMPKTVASPGGSIALKATAAAKAKWGDKFVKVVYFENDWRAIKSQENPNKIMGYNMSVGVILYNIQYYYLQKFALAKGESGENIIVGPLGEMSKINYKQ